MIGRLHGEGEFLHCRKGTWEEKVLPSFTFQTASDLGEDVEEASKNVVIYRCQRERERVNLCDLKPAESGSPRFIFCLK